MRMSDWSSDVCSSDLHVVAVAEPPAPGGAAEVEVQLAAHRGSGVVVVAGVADRACQAPAARAVDAEVVERETLAVADQEIQSCARHALAVVEAEVVLQVERSEEHTSELQSLMRISYAVSCLKKKTSNSQT